MSARQRRLQTRIKLYRKQRGKCAYCNKRLSLAETTLDHIVPRAVARGLHGNLCVACKSCNTKKGSMLPHVWFGLLSQGLAA